MSDDNGEIICRQCNETFRVEAGSCPACGTDVRNGRNLGVVVAIGLVIGALAVYAQQFLLAAIALGFAGAVGYLIYDKRNRMERAAKRTGTEQAGRPTE